MSNQSYSKRRELYEGSGSNVRRIRTNIWNPAAGGIGSRGGGNPFGNDDWAQKTVELETEYTVGQVWKLADVVYQEDKQDAAIASGSFRKDAMVVVPCSMKTLSAISYGFSNNLISRAADVTLKEQHKLILVPREPPLNPMQLENMLRLSQVNALIMPSMPAFYNHPKTVEDVVSHTVSRLLDHIGIESDIARRWK